MRQQVKYLFKYIDLCNMCGSSTDKHKILGKRLNRSQGRNPKSLAGITTTVMKCTTCGLIYSNPQPIPEDISDHYGIPPEGYWKAEYFKNDLNYFNQEISTLKKLIKLPTEPKSLDIGAGLGKAMIALKNAGFDSYGLEPSEPFYQRAITDFKIDPKNLQLGAVENVQYPDNYFDFITFGAVLEHLYDPSASIKKALKWLKAGGLIHIEVPSSKWVVNKIINFYYRLKGADYVGNISPMHPPFHLFEFDRKSFIIHAQQNGYEVVFHEYYVCQTFLPKILDPILKPYMKATNQGMQLCVWLKKQ